MRLLQVAILGLLALSLSHIPSKGENRVALVIGNGKYKHTSVLPNPVNDADLMAKQLRGLGYDVVVGKDLTNSDFRSILRTFVTKLQSATTGVFFYAGHGLQVDGRNYLMPVDSDINIAADLRWQTIDMQDILDEMQDKKRTSIILLDACRSNPLSRRLARKLKSRSAIVGRGLARITGGSGTFVGFATAPGEVALDGVGRNSPFTKSLASHVGTPRLHVSLMMQRVRADVMKATNESQIPWSNSSLYRDFQFNPLKQDNKPLSFAPASAKPKRAKTENSNRSAALQDWTEVKEIGSCDAYLTYEQAHPGTFYARLAHLWRKKNCLTENKKKADSAESPTTSEKLVPESVSPSSGALANCSAGTVKVDVVGKGHQCLDTRYASKREFRDCFKVNGQDLCGPTVVTLPTGRFRLGSPSNEIGRSTSEEPVSEQEIDYHFAIGKFELTWRDWKLCASDGVCTNDPRKWTGGGEQWLADQLPVVGVTWKQANQYLAWLSRKTNKTYRLPSEIEWEYAARGKSKLSALPQPYSWGGDVRRNMANCRGCGSKWDGSRPAPVGSFKPNPFGIFDLHGNVREWTSDCWRETYSESIASLTAMPSGTCQDKVTRGGSWDHVPSSLRSASRGKQIAIEQYVLNGQSLPAQAKSRSLGLRVVREIAPSRRANVTKPLLKKTNSVTDHEDRTLVRSIQAKLRDHGCLIGEVDGIWGDNTAASVHDFFGNAGKDLFDYSQSPDQKLLDDLHAVPSETSCASRIVGETPEDKAVLDRDGCGLFDSDCKHKAALKRQWEAAWPLCSVTGGCPPRPE